MDDTFYGLQAKPFSIVPDPDCIYPARSHCAAMAVLEHAIRERTGFSLITGEVGTGKTTLMRRLLSHPPKGYLAGLVGSPHASHGPLLGRALLALGVQADDGQPLRMVEQYQLFAEEMVRSGRRAILIFDEVQAMDGDRLDELRMLPTVATDGWMPHIVLVGLPGIRDTLRQQSMRQLAQRVVGDCELRALDQDETRRYIAYRLRHAGAGEEPIFDDDACDAVHRHSGGIPRLINILCEDALIVGGIARRRPIDAATVLAMAEERRRSGILPLGVAEQAVAAIAAGAASAMSRLASA